jgi:hypothetical protein
VDGQPDAERLAGPRQPLDAIRQQRPARGGQAGAPVGRNPSGEEEAPLVAPHPEDQLGDVQGAQCARHAQRVREVGRLPRGIVQADPAEVAGQGEAVPGEQSPERLGVRGKARAVLGALVACLHHLGQDSLDGERRTKTRQVVIVPVHGRRGDPDHAPSD